MEIKNDIFEKSFEEELDGVKFEEIEVVDTTPTTMIGKVSCKKLNVREEPDANSEVVCVVDAGTELMIDPAYSTDEWYCVCTSAGLDGFCMKKFVTITAL